jgi:predicted phage-related endonuclease
MERRMTVAEQYEWAKANAPHLDEMNTDYLDTSILPIHTAVKDIDQLPNEVYALLRKNGLGCSDSSVLVSVNPYKKLEELIEEKSRNYLTPEEAAVSDQVAVRKGVDLEPFIIQKHSQISGRRIMKPANMYRHNDFPFLTVNFDGVMECYDDDGTLHYIPDEIKVCTEQGARHYDRTKADWRESTGYATDGLISQHIADSTASIIEKANRYGIPPYYYTQVQMEMYHLGAPFGYLTVLFEKEWEMCTWFVWQDKHTQNQVVIAAAKAWDKIAPHKPKDALEDNITTLQRDIAEAESETHTDIAEDI